MRGPVGLIDGKGLGQPSLLNDAQRAALAAVVESGPMPAVHGVARWRLIDLCHWVWQMFRISISPQTMSRELRATDDRKLLRATAPSWAGRRGDRAFRKSA